MLEDWKLKDWKLEDWKRRRLKRRRLKKRKLKTRRFMRVCRREGQLKRCFMKKLVLHMYIDWIVGCKAKMIAFLPDRAVVHVCFVPWDSGSSQAPFDVLLLYSSYSSKFRFYKQFLVDTLPSACSNCFEFQHYLPLSRPFFQKSIPSVNNFKTTLYHCFLDD